MSWLILISTWLPATLANASAYQDFTSSDGRLIRGKLMGWSEDGQMNFMRQDDGQVYLIPFTFWDEATRTRLMGEAIEAFRRSGQIRLHVDTMAYERLKLDFGPQMQMDDQSEAMMNAWSTSTCRVSDFASGLIRVVNETAIPLEGLRLEVRVRPGELHTLTRVSDMDTLRDSEVKLLGSGDLDATFHVNYAVTLEPLQTGEMRLLALPPAFPTEFLHHDKERRVSYANQELEYAMDARLVYEGEVLTLESDTSVTPSEADEEEAAETPAAIDEPWPESLEPKPLTYTASVDNHRGEGSSRQRTFAAEPWVLLRRLDNRVEHPGAPHLNDLHQLSSASGKVLDVELVSLTNGQVSFVVEGRGGTQQVPLSTLSENSQAYVQRWDRLRSLAAEVRFDFKRRTSSYGDSRYSYRDEIKTKEFVGSVELTRNLREAKAMLVMVCVHREYREISTGTQTVEVYRSLTREHHEADANDVLTLEMRLGGDHIQALDGIWMGVYAEGALLAHATYPEDFNPWEVDFGEPTRF